MTPAPPEVINQPTTAFRRIMASSADVTSRIVIRPVFVDDAGRRRKLIAGCGYLAALACIGYIVTVGISLTAGPTGPLAAMADPQPHLVDEIAQPTSVPVTATARAAAVVRPTPAPQPRTVRTTVAKAVTHPVVATTTAPVAPPIVVTTPAVPTTRPCSRRTCATSPTAPTTDSSTSTSSAAQTPPPPNSTGS
jgi:hypothetical protein